jgi:hypothetical protein
MSNPFEAQGIPPIPPQGAAAAKVNAPATALMVVAILNILLALWGMVNGVMSLGAPPPQAPPMQGVDPQMIMNIMRVAGPVGIALALLQLVVAVVILLGALKMKKLESWGLAMGASVLAMIPCLSSCCLLGLPFGIWALVVINSVDVKSAFR